MAPFGARVVLLGALDAQALQERYSNAGLLFWPGVNEAFGVTYLEAQAAGIPVVAQDRPGVRDVVAGPHPAVSEGPEAMAARLAALLQDTDARRAAGTTARHAMRDHHLLGTAARTLGAVLEAAL